MATIQSNIHESILDAGARIFIARTGAKDIVTVQGSVLGGPNHLPKDSTAVAHLTSELLDAGTKTKSKEELRTLLASRGANLSFFSSGDRTFFSGTCLPEDVTLLLSLATECLHSSVFTAKELELAKERLLGELIEEKSDTRTQGSIAFSRELYDKHHVQYRATTEERIASLKKISRADLVQHAQFGQSGLILSVVGDVQIEKTKRAVEVAMKHLPKLGHEVPAKKLNSKKSAGREVFVSIPDKTNIDTYIGTGVPITSGDTSYLHLVTLISLLGGRGLASGHLMRTIRERDGLTYHISASPAGFAVDTDGAFQIYATFSPATFKKAVLATKKEIAFFFTKGITKEALSSKKDELAGSYLVRLATTTGLASELHKIGIDGKPLSYIDEYPKLIREITLPQLKEIAKTIPYQNFSTVASGTLPK